MKKNYKLIIEEFLSRNFWGILFAGISFLTIVLIALLGLGVFILATIVGFLAFVLGNSKDKGISPIENLKMIIDKINEKVRSIKR